MMTIPKRMKNNNKRMARENHKIRTSPSYKLFRDTVLARDDHTCQICGSSENVEAHHMYSFETKPEHRLNPNYGICLCASCHLKYHEMFDNNLQINPRSLRKFKDEFKGERHGI